MPEIKAIIFDMDGVLVDSEPIHQKVEVEICHEFGIEVPADAWDNFHGQKLKEIYEHVSKKYGKGDEPIEKMMKRKIEIYLGVALQEMRLVAGVTEFLNKLETSKKFAYAIATSGPKMQQDKILEKFKLEHFFSIMVTADDVTRGKPDPEVYAFTAKKLNIAPENCLVIEDSDNGIISAKAAGCQACGITTTFPRERLEKAGADMVVANFSELEKILF